MDAEDVAKRQVVSYTGEEIEACGEVEKIDPNGEYFLVEIESRRFLVYVNENLEGGYMAEIGTMWSFKS